MENDERETAHEGWVPDLQDPEDLFHVVEEAFDYRGDVTVITRDEETVEGFIFDRVKEEDIEESFLRIIPDQQDEQNRKIPYANIKQIEFSGTDATKKNPWPPEDS